MTKNSVSYDNAVMALIESYCAVVPSKQAAELRELKTQLYHSACGRNEDYKKEAFRSVVSVLHACAHEALREDAGIGWRWMRRIELLEEVLGLRQRPVSEAACLKRVFEVIEHQADGAPGDWQRSFSGLVDAGRLGNTTVDVTIGAAAMAIAIANAISDKLKKERPLLAAEWECRGREIEAVAEIYLDNK